MNFPCLCGMHFYLEQYILLVLDICNYLRAIQQYLSFPVSVHSVELIHYCSTAPNQEFSLTSTVWIYSGCSYGILISNLLFIIKIWSLSSWSSTHVPLESIAILFFSLWRSWFPRFSPSLSVWLYLNEPLVVRISLIRIRSIFLFFIKVVLFFTYSTCYFCSPTLMRVMTIAGDDPLIQSLLTTIFAYRFFGRQSQSELFSFFPTIVKLLLISFYLSLMRLSFDL